MVNRLFLNGAFKFLVDSRFVIFKLKQNKMAYYFFGSNETYNSPLNFNTFIPSFNYLSYDNYGFQPSFNMN